MIAKFSSTTPTLVTPVAPNFNVIETKSESNKRNVIVLNDSYPIYQWKLNWDRASDDTYAYILGHFISAQGSGSSFTWKCVPSYIDADHDGVADGSSVTGFWVTNSFKAKPNAYSWDIDLTFEEYV